MKHHTNVTGLNYFGGKATKSRNRWVAGLLPWAKTDTYVEPFGGMMSVLLYRAQTDCEIYNDLNGDIVNWWRCIQMARTEFMERVEATPHSRAELEKARRILSEPFVLTDEPDLARGHAVYALLMNSQVKIVSPHKVGGSFSVIFSGRVGSLGLWQRERMNALAQRIRNVQLEKTDAVHLLRRCLDRPQVVAYIDPPYAQAVSGGSDYDFTCDYDAMTEVVKAETTARMAISGYGTEWDHLDWYRYEKKDTFSDISRGTHSERTEVLWCNYDARKEGSAFWDAMSISDRFEEKAERWD